MKIRRTYTRKFKLQIVCECENSKAMAQLSRQHGEDARLGELKRVIGQLYTENSFLKKALSNLEMRLQ
jgi:hypothetical protein